MNPDQRLKTSVFVLVLVLATGTLGYRFLQDWTLLDAFYMTVITLSTVGFREVHDLTIAGKLFTMFLVFFGVAAMAYALKSATQVMLEGELRHVLGRRKVKKTIGGLKNHYIICGFGRMGRIIAREFRSANRSFVVIERDAEVVATVTDPAMLLMQGDATLDDTLEEAGIGKARGVIAVLQSDADNLLVVLSARSLNPDLRIVARASEEGVERKLMRAGADKVVSPYQMGGMRIAHAVLKPAVSDFLELTTQSGDVDLAIEQLGVGDGSPLAGKTLTESHLRQDFDVIIVAIRRRDGEMVFNPRHDTRITAGDTVILLGDPAQLENLERMAA